MSHRFGNWSAGCIALCLLSMIARAAEPATQPADDENPHLWRPQTKSVTVFKNGFGFFMGEADVALRDGWCVAREVPPAAFGTLAIFAHDKAHLVDMVGAGPGEVVEFDDRDAPKDAAAKRTRLEATKNLNVSLTYAHKGNDRTAAGKLVSVGPEFVVLEQEGANSFAVPLTGITKMQILDLPVRVHVSSDGDKSPDRSKLGMAYLRRGITWIPEYTLKVLDDNSAELTLRGTLVNEAEDLIHTDVHLVVGVPHFLHSDYMAPVAVGQVIRTIGAAVAPRGLQEQIMNRGAIATNTITANQFERSVAERHAEGGAGNVAQAIGNLPQLDSAAGSDFTVYTKKDVTLRRGEKAIITLFVKKVPYSHIYHWETPKQIQHSLVLHNDTDTAWTTGPCLAVSGDRPLSEDLLKYTPRNGRCELPVTAAVNIASDQSESEIDRKLKAHSPRDHEFFDLVTLEGTLKLRNYEKTAVEVLVSCTVAGKPIAVSDDGAMSINPGKLQLKDREGTYRWRVLLKPGEGKTLTYRYERFVPSH